jgi:RNAse (barnase) inhibitor barstar
MENSEIIIDCSNIKDKKELHEQFKTKLNFPEYYGMNWDAFWDCITEINNLPNKLIMKNWSKLKLKLPKDTKIFEEIISDFKNENPNINFNIEYN